MTLISYVPKSFKDRTLAIIAKANEIILEYEEQGFNLTLRQLYYQFVSRDLIRNTQKEYNRLGAIINDARLAGLVHWESIVDRTRGLRSLSHWNSPSEILLTCSKQYTRNLWAGQSVTPEVWIEKDALVGVIEGVCTEWDVPFLSCRGYVSQSEMWRAGRRLAMRPRPYIIHLGDHDPSGIDMTRDIQERLNMFAGNVTVNRIALTMDQVEEHGPPPNPAKLSDSRASEYIARFGNDSWELDALEPALMANLIEEEIKNTVDMDMFEAAKKRQEKERRQLVDVAENWKE